MKTFRTFDKARQLLKWLKESVFEETTDWDYFQTNNVGLPDEIVFMNDELYVLFVLTWGERKAIPKYVNGKRAGYINSP